MCAALKSDVQCRPAGSAADSWRSLLARPKVPLAAAGVYLVAAIAAIARPQMLPEAVRPCM